MTYWPADVLASNTTGGGIAGRVTLGTIIITKDVVFASVMLLALLWGGTPVAATTISAMKAGGNEAPN